MSTLQNFFSTLPTHVKDTISEYKKSINNNRFYKNKDYILNHKDTKQILFNKNRWELRPYLFCIDIYSEAEQYLYPVILTINNINSIHSFLPENFKDQLILTPNTATIRKILTLK